jgi:hypothetical protein
MHGRLVDIQTIYTGYAFIGPSRRRSDKHRTYVVTVD